MRDGQIGSHVVDAESPMWRVVGGNKLVEEKSFTMRLEEHVEDLVESEPSCLGKPLLIIGRQRFIKEGGGVDLLALDATASTVLIELKVNEANRDTMGQVIEYWAWATTLTTDQILAMYARYRPGKDLADAFFKRFGCRLPPVLNESQDVIIVAATISSRTQHSIRSLQQKGFSLTLFGYRYYPGLSAIQFVPLIEADQDSEVDAGSGEPNRGRLASAGELARLHASLNHLYGSLEEFRPTLEALRRPPAAATTHGPMSDMSSIDQYILLFWLTHARSFAWDFVPFSFLYELYLHWLRTQAATGLHLDVLDVPTFGRRLAKAATATGEWSRTKHRPDKLIDAPEPLMELVPGWKRPEGNPHIYGYLRSGAEKSLGAANQP